MNVVSVKQYTKNLTWVPLFLLVCVILFAWQTLAHLTWIDTGKWSSPLAAYKILQNDAFHPINPVAGDVQGSKTLLAHVGITLKLWVICFITSAVMGITGGYLLGSFSVLHALGYPIANFLRGLPSAAIWPLCVLIFGISTRSQELVVIFGAVWPILLNSVQGIRNIPTEVTDSLLFMKLSQSQRVAVRLQCAAPSIFTGLEVSCAIAFLLSVTVQLLQSNEGGLGWYIFMYQQVPDTDGVFAGLFVTAALGWGLNTFTHTVRRVLIPWEIDGRDKMRQRKGPWAQKLLLRIKDSSVRTILQDDYVTEAVQKEFGLKDVSDTHLEMLYMGEPYIFPDELSKYLRTSAANAQLVQREIKLGVKHNNSDEFDSVLFARSWINKSRLSKESTKRLEEAYVDKVHNGEFTIGCIVRECENGRKITNKNLWYRSVVSENLSMMFAGDGVSEFIQRARLIQIDGIPVILIHEFVPVKHNTNLTNPSEYGSS